MFSIKNNILYFIFLNILVQIQSLVELPAVEENDIATTELTLRSVVNSIFSTLKLIRVKRKARFKEFAEIHNYFVSITLQDHNNLKEIARLAKVDKIDNKTLDFIAQLNEVLNEDNKSNEALDDVYVTTHIETFIKKLENLKYKYGFKNNIGNYDINKEVLKHLNKDHNVLVNKTTLNESDGSLLSDIEFWKPSGRRIYEGKRVKIKRFPFMASVQFFKKFQCGGSIIKSDLVITSASCLQLAWNNRFFRENPAFLSVQVGCNFYESGDENIPILEVYFHPEYNPKNLVNNLAIMRLTRILNFGRKVKSIKKIDFDRNAWPLSEATAGITIIGWGARGSSNILGTPWSNRLGFAELDFYPLRECQDVYSKEYVTYKNFCAGFFSKGGGACNRDVGGPGIANGILMGVVSFGSPNCGAPDAPTVFTKLGYYTEWIEGIMEQNVPIARKSTTERPPKISRDFNIHTEITTFKITPLQKGKEDTPVPIQKVDTLRILDENLFFKEFIKTMFDNDRVEDYIDEIDAETAEPDKPIEVEDIANGALTKVFTRAKVVPTTVATTKGNISIPISIINQIPAPILKIEDISALNDDMNQVESVKMVTTVEKFDAFDSSLDLESGTRPEKLKKYTVLFEDKAEGKNVEQNIAKLINDIDIEDLLDSNSETEESSKSEEGTKKLLTDRLSDLSESDDTDDSSTGDSDDLLMNLIKSSKNDRKESPTRNIKEKEHVDAGLSIPIEPFRDLTFRQNTSRNFLDVFSNDDLIQFLTEALQSQAKKYT